jgi:glucose/arabinose dehydrogenase
LVGQRPRAGFLSVSFPRRPHRSFCVGRWLLTALCVAGGGALYAVDETDYYRLVSFEMPPDAVLEVGGMTRAPDGALVFCTRRGDVIRVDSPDGPPAAMKYHRFATGLHSPLGILAHQDAYYVVQLGELTRLRDTDGDGTADEYTTICDDWGFSGNFHEFAYGPRMDGDGKLWVALNIPFGEEPYGRAPWRGWALRIDPQTGVMEPMAAGMRSPSGIDISPAGDVFFTDNQGDWCNASKLSHISRGDFHGHPYSLHSAADPRSPLKNVRAAPDRLFTRDVPTKVPSFKLPSVWFPFQKAGRGPSGMVWDTTGGTFGPFSGQVFVGEFRQSRVFRVQLEKIKGHWQGALFPFRSGFNSGVFRLLFSDAGHLLAGMTRRGWGSIGAKQFGIQRVEWTGVTPLEIQNMQVRKDGFVLEFTLPVNPETCTPGAFQLESYTYRLSKTYGGPEEEKREHTIVAVELGAAGRKVFLRVPDLREGFVHELHAGPVRALDSTPLLHDVAYYTLMNLPD